MAKRNFKTNSDILRTVHETAGGLHKHGFISKKQMAHYDALCLEPVPAYTTAKVKALRRRLNISQAVLASVINTSVSTVQKWETGDKTPSGPSAKLLSILERKGLEALV